MIFWGRNVDSTTRLVRLELNGTLDRIIDLEYDEFPILFDLRPGGGLVATYRSFIARFKDDGTREGNYTADLRGLPSAMHIERNGDVFLGFRYGQLLPVPSVGGNFVHGFARVLANPPQTQLLVTPANPDLTHYDSCVDMVELYASAEEVGGAARLNLLRQGDSSAAARVRFSTLDGTAKAGQDYTSASGRIEFSPLENQKTIAIPVLNNFASEDRIFTVQFIESEGFETIQKSITVKIPKNFAQKPAASVNVVGGTKLQLSNLYPEFSYQLQTSKDLKNWQTEASVAQGTTEFLLSELQFTSESRQFFRVVTGSPIRRSCN